MIPVPPAGQSRQPRPASEVLLACALLTALALFATATVAADTARDLDPQFAWPLSPTPDVVQGFDPPSTPYGPGHRGVDLAARPGQQVLAAGPGVVVFAGELAGRGVVSIDHDGGLRTTYEPVSPSVSAGDQVHQEQVIATVSAGHEDCLEPACLHWGVRRGEQYLNPLPLVSRDVTIRLKPWRDGP